MRGMDRFLKLRLFSPLLMGPLRPRGDHKLQIINRLFHNLFPLLLLLHIRGFLPLRLLSLFIFLSFLLLLFLRLLPTLLINLSLLFSSLRLIHLSNIFILGRLSPNSLGRFNGNLWPLRL
ncbi:hypothetical protein HanIR_Chr09g0444031 [Helianthus annuus]|nr:hypothetical protein HanIR_Chr09g0444031 [Helianthus annuus]